MPECNKQTVLAFEDAKQAALLFDYVIPFELSELTSAGDNNLIHSCRQLQHLLPEALRSSSHPIGNDAVIAYVSQYLCALPAIWGITELPGNETLEECATSSLPKLIEGAGGLVAQSETDFGGVFHRGLQNSASEGELNPMIQISGIELVDTKRIEWDHLIAFRRDEESTKKFRRFRHFVLQNYQGKPAGYIEDDILSRYEDYKASLRSWDLRTLPGVLSTTLSAKSLPAALAAIGTFVGVGSMPVAMAIGTSLELGSIILEVAKRRYKRAEIEAQSPIAYVAEIKNLE